MISINTNLSSLIIQNNLKSATGGLNQAIERMTTGFKINGAKDNAANYSISTNLTTKIGAYDVAESNTSMGLDMLTTATESLDVVSSNLSRIRALAEQAANGTYGAGSLSAIQNEALTRLSECTRVLKTTEYNNITVFEPEPIPPPTGGSFIAKVDYIYSEEEAIVQGFTPISTADDLQLIKNDLSGKYILMDNIDLSGSTWTAIANFTGELNGNGHIIENLASTRALFTSTNGATIKDLGLENVQINSSSAVAGLVVSAIDTTITNCYTTGSVTSTITYNASGGLCGNTIGSTIANCYSGVKVIAGGNVGGFIGYVENSTITNCYATGDSDMAGFVGIMHSGTISNCYATGNAANASYGTGGLVANNEGGIIKNCYSTGDVSNSAYLGGFVGKNSGTIENCFATGDLSNTSTYSGGFSSQNPGTITNCYSTGISPGTNGSRMGPFIGINAGTITNCAWDKDKNGVTTGGTAHIQALSTSEINSKIASGDFLRKFEYELTQVEFIDKNTPPLPNVIGFQVGIDSEAKSEIKLDFSFYLNLEIDLSTSEKALLALEKIDEYLSKINIKQTEYGSMQNRLMSALEEITVQRENLISSRSTLRDADISEVSSTYIQQQILQQASATLLATANQTPAIALQLL